MTINTYIYTTHVFVCLWRAERNSLETRQQCQRHTKAQFRAMNSIVFDVKPIFSISSVQAWRWNAYVSIVYEGDASSILTDWLHVSISHLPFLPLTKCYRLRFYLQQFLKMWFNKFQLDSYQINSNKCS